MSLLYVPSGQLAHSDIPCDNPYFPGWQSAQSLMSAPPFPGKKVPFGHSVQCDAPVISEYVPFPQGEHAVIPMADANSPTGQSWQAAAEVALTVVEYLPVGHKMHELIEVCAPCELYLPAGQFC